MFFALPPVMVYFLNHPRVGYRFLDETEMYYTPPSSDPRIIYKIVNGEQERVRYGEQEENVVKGEEAETKQLRSARDERSTAQPSNVSYGNEIRGRHKRSVGGVRLEGEEIKLIDGFYNAE